MPPNSETRGTAARGRWEWMWWLLLAIALGTAVFVRIRLLAMPLERDEGEYAYAGQLLLQGVPPYKLAYNMKFPGTYAAYAFFMAIFGQTPVAIHLALILLNLATAALLFLIARRITSSWAAAIAAASLYVTATLSPAVLGLATHIEHFVLPPALAAMWLLLDTRVRIGTRRVFLAGVLFGLAVLMKQPGVFFLVAGACYIAVLAWRKRARAIDLLVLGGGASVPIALALLLLWIAGVFPAFWFWTIDYARAYGSIVPLREGLLIAANTARKTLLPLWPICALGITGVLCLLARRELRRHAIFIALLGAACLAALSSGLYFREHYYLYLLAFLALCVGGAVAAAPPSFPPQMMAVVIVAAAAAYPVMRDAKLFFGRSPEEACRQIYRGNIFADAPRLGAFLRDRTTAGDSIAVIGSEPEIYFYAGRRSASGYIYTYALMEEHRYVRKMQQEMEREIEAAQPKFLVYVSVPMSWGIGRWSELSFFNWLHDFQRDNYQPIGAVNILADGTSDYCVPCIREMQPWPPSVLISQRTSP